MRILAVAVVLLGLAAIGFITCQSLWMPVSAPEDLAAAEESAVVLQRLIGWAVFVGFVALATLASVLEKL